MTAYAQVHVCSYNAQEAINWSNSDQVHRLDMCHQAQKKSSDITLPQALKSIFQRKFNWKAVYVCVCVCACAFFFWDRYPSWNSLKKPVLIYQAVGPAMVWQRLVLDFLSMVRSA